jgi:nucleotide-binding universal stress UspA family protein
MMRAERPERPGRVIVGVHLSLSGLQALRVAVAEARSRRTQLHAVRTTDPSPPDPNITAATLPDEPPLSSEATAVITKAFADTMGGTPPDLDVRTVIMPDSPGPVLVEYACRDADMLVIGGGKRNRWIRPWRSRVVRYCLGHASCPVLVVPPPPLTRDGSPRSLMRELRRELDHLTGDQPDR